MTKWYPSNTAASPTPTDSGALSNSPTGAGNWTKYTPGKLLHTFSGGPNSATMSNLTNNQTRSFVWITEAGDTNLATFEQGGFTLNFHVTDVSGSGAGTTAAVRLAARVLRFGSDSDLDQAGTASATTDISDADFGSSPLPRLVRLDIPPTAFSSGSTSDMLGLLIYVTEIGNRDNTNITIEVDSAATFLSDEVALATIEGFDHLSAASNYTGSAFCSVVDGGNGCGLGLANVRSPIPGTLTGIDGTFVAASYTVVTGLMGDGHAIESPSSITFALQNTNVADSWIVGFRAKVSSLASTQQLVSVGSSGPARSISIDINTSGKFEIWGGGSGPGTASNIAVSNEGISVDTVFHVEYILYKHATAGAFEVRLNGTAVTWASGAASNVDTAGATNAVFFDSATLTIDDLYVFAGNTSSLPTSAALATPTRLPRFSTLLPVSQGSQNDFDRYSGATGLTVAFVGAGNSTNHDYVDDPHNDGPLTFLSSNNTGDQDSWIMGALTADADEIVAFVTSLCCVGENTNVNIHEVWLGGTAYQIDDLGVITDHDFELLNVGAQYHYTARHWTERPDGGGAWDPADFAALEMGVGSNNNINIGITQARAMVLWYEPQAPAGPDFLWTLPQLGVGW